MRSRRRIFRSKDKGDAGAQRLTEDNWESLIDRHGHARRRASLEDEMLAVEPVAVDADYDEAAIVMSVASARCRVFRDGLELDVMVPAEMAVPKDRPPDELFRALSTRLAIETTPMMTKP